MMSATQEQAIQPVEEDTLHLSQHHESEGNPDEAEDVDMDELALVEQCGPQMTGLGGLSSMPVAQGMPSL